MFDSNFAIDGQIILIIFRIDMCVIEISVLYNNYLPIVIILYNQIIDKFRIYFSVYILYTLYIY